MCIRDSFSFFFLSFFFPPISSASCLHRASIFIPLPRLPRRLCRVTCFLRLIHTFALTHIPAWRWAQYSLHSSPGQSPVLNFFISVLRHRGASQISLFLPWPQSSLCDPFPRSASWIILSTAFSTPALLLLPCLPCFSLARFPFAFDPVSAPFFPCLLLIFFTGFGTGYHRFFLTSFLIHDLMAPP